jgi:hypothetical protein
MTEGGVDLAKVRAGGVVIMETVEKGLLAKGLKA